MTTAPLTELQHDTVERWLDRLKQGVDNGNNAAQEAAWTAFAACNPTKAEELRPTRMEDAA